MTRDGEAQDVSGGGGAARLVLSLGAAGEMGVGAALLVLPSILEAILGSSLDPIGLFVARMFAMAILALGATWWIAGRAPGGAVRCTSGFLVYNLGLGALFLLHAVREGSATPLTWAVGVVHVLLGLGFGAALVSARPALSRVR